MAYSSIPENETREAVFSSYEHISSILRMTSRYDERIYLCVVSQSAGKPSIRPVDLPGLVEVVDVGDYTDLIIEASSEDIGNIAKIIYEQTGLPVGVVKYQESQTPGLMQSNAILAARRAGKNGTGFYVFDEYRDSVQHRLSHLTH